MTSPTSIGSINKLPELERREIYRRFLPPELLERFGITSELTDADGHTLVEFHFETGATDVVVKLRHRLGAEDPILYAHLTDTMNGQLHVLLYVINDPDSERFDIDRMPDGSSTHFGVDLRNVTAEVAAMRAGLSPGQIRKGLRMLKHVVRSLEDFAAYLGQSMALIEPLYYHNAISFERHGFFYLQGRQLMEALHTAFSPGGDLVARLDGSTPFRDPSYAGSIRGRSWALHDGVSEQPFSGVTMYKRIGQTSSINTFPGGVW
jgi:hypothetical protein